MKYTINTLSRRMSLRVKSLINNVLGILPHLIYPHLTILFFRKTSRAQHQIPTFSSALSSSYQLYLLYHTLFIEKIFI